MSLPVESPGIIAILIGLQTDNPPTDGQQLGAAIKHFNLTPEGPPLGPQVADALHDPVNLLGVVPFTPDHGGF